MVQLLVELYGVMVNKCETDGKSLTINGTKPRVQLEDGALLMKDELTHGSFEVMLGW